MDLVTDVYHSHFSHTGGPGRKDLPVITVYWGVPGKT